MTSLGGGLYSLSVCCCCCERSETSEYERDLLIDADCIKASVHDVHPAVLGRQYEQGHQSLHAHTHILTNRHTYTHTNKHRQSLLTSLRPSSAVARLTGDATVVTDIQVYARCSSLEIKRHRIETLTQCAEPSQFAVDY